MHNRMRKHNSVRGPEKSRVSKKDTLAFHKTSSDLGNTLEVLRNQLHELKKEIRADRQGKKEFEEQLGLLKRKREFISKRYEANKNWAKEFDKAIGPFERKYSGLTKEMTGLYDNAKDEHAKGIQVLMEEFKYHPIFKRWNDDFSGTPFRPK